MISCADFDDYNDFLWVSDDCGDDCDDDDDHDEVVPGSVILMMTMISCGSMMFMVMMTMISCGSMRFMVMMTHTCYGST